MSRLRPLLLLLGTLCAISHADPKTPVFSMPIQVFGENVDVAEPIIAFSSAWPKDLWVMASGEGVIRACVDCPNWPQVYVHSRDGGQTWSDYQYICGTNCSGVSLQADPWLVAAPSGMLYASWMNSLSIVTSYAQNGFFWSPPINVSLNVGPADKGAISVSDDESIVMIAFNGNRYPYAVFSMDKGKTWSDPERMIADPQDYPDYEFFGNGGMILADGTCVSTQGGFYNPGNSSDQSLPAALHIYASHPKYNRTWERIFDWHFYAAEYCPEWAACEDPGQFFGPTVVIAADHNTTFYAFATAAALNSQEPDLTVRPLFFVSSNGGGSWTTPVDLSTAPGGQYVYHGFPLIAATGVGDVRVAWMDNRTGFWNVFYRASQDGGQTWSAEVLISTYGGMNAPFHNDKGFLWPYGDYGGLVIDNDSASHIVWGEGLGWFQGGRVYYARSPPLPEPEGKGLSAFYYATWALTGAMAITVTALIVVTVLWCRERGKIQYTQVQ